MIIEVVLQIGAYPIKEECPGNGFPIPRLL
jgi:hypothetical protein